MKLVLSFTISNKQETYNTKFSVHQNIFFLYYIFAILIGK